MNPSSLPRSYSSHANDVFRFCGVGSSICREPLPNSDVPGDLDRHLRRSKEPKVGTAANASTFDSATVETQSLTCSVVTGESFTSESDQELNKENSAVLNCGGRPAQIPEQRPHVEISSCSYELEDLAHLSHGLECDGSSSYDVRSGSSVSTQSSISRQPSHRNMPRTVTAPCDDQEEDSYLCINDNYERESVCTESRSVVETYDLKMAIIRTEEARVDAKHAPLKSVRPFKAKTSEEIVSSILLSSVVRNQPKANKNIDGIRRTVALMQLENDRRRQKIRSLKDGRNTKSDVDKGKKSVVDSDTSHIEFLKRGNTINDVEEWEFFSSSTEFDSNSIMAGTYQACCDDSATATSGYLSSEDSFSRSSASDVGTTPWMKKEEFKREDVCVPTDLESTTPPLIIIKEYPSGSKDQDGRSREVKTTISPHSKTDMLPNTLHQCTQQQRVELIDSDANEALNGNVNVNVTKAPRKWHFLHCAKKRLNCHYPRARGKQIGKQIPCLYEEGTSLLESVDGYVHDPYDSVPLHDIVQQPTTSTIHVRKEDFGPNKPTAYKMQAQSLALSENCKHNAIVPTHCHSASSAEGTISKTPVV